MTAPSGEAVYAPTLAQRLEFTVMKGTIAALRALPWSAATRLGETIGKLGYHPLRIRRGVVERQIAAAFPEMPRQQVIETAKAAYAHLGRCAIEIALLPSLGREKVLELVPESPGWDALEEALAAGKGAILVAGHIGNWELGGAYVAARGVGIDAIARRMRNQLFDRYLHDTRTRLGMAVVHDSDAVRRTPRSLRENRTVAFLSDQGVRGLASTFVPFFGRPAKTPRGPAVLALRLGVPVLFAGAIRRPDGRYEFRLERVPITDTGDRERDVDTIVAAYTAILEKWVRKTPDQYFWHHRRWKRQPADTPAHLREP